MSIVCYNNYMDMITPYDYVDVQIDTSKPRGRWIFFQSASLPFGMVQLQPDNKLDGCWNVGYRYKEKRVKCFSHVHQWQLGGIAVLPIIYKVPYENGYRYSHKTEIAKPGYHSLYLQDCQVTAELSATYRVGIHKYTYPSVKTKILLIDLARQLGPSEMAGYKVKKIDHQSIEGYVINAPTIRRAKSCKIYFHISLDQPFIMEDRLGQLFLSMENISTQQLVMKVALSFVSSQNAKENMISELPHFDFDKVKDNAKKVWNEHLSKVTIKSKKHKVLVKFYTDLWRSAMGGHIISDVNNEYLDMTSKKAIIRKTTGHPMISNADIFWGNHWSLSIIYDLFYPKIKSDYVKSLITFSNNGGYIPRGPSGGNYTYVMIGAHSGCFIISAYFKGITDFSLEDAYKGIYANAFPGGLMSKSGYEHHSCFDGGIESYIDKGYIPIRERKSSGFHCDSASQTIEYSFDDWCLSNYANALGKIKDSKYFHDRSRNYQHLFDTETGFLRPKYKNNHFMTPFDPRDTKEFCEGNSWSYTFYATYDLLHLARLMGGKETLIKKLDGAFKKSIINKFYAKKPATRRNKAYINYGNENMRFTAAVFHEVGASHLSQKWTRLIKERLFSSTGKNGFREDDDCGLSAGTSLLLGLGLFDIKGGAYENPSYMITAPIFDEIIINLDKQYYSGKQLHIKTYHNSKRNKYISKILFNNKEIKGFTISHKQLVQGGFLEIFLTNRPNKT